MNLVGQNKELRLVFLRGSLTPELNQEIPALLGEFGDVFAWTYAEMPGLDLHLVTHKLNIKEGTKSVKQASRHFRPELEI